MKKIFAFILSLAVAMICHAQSLTVESFGADPSDLSASAKPVYDSQNKRCALVKVRCVLPDMKFKGNIIGTPSLLGGEYSIYMPEGSDELVISAKDVPDLVVNFNKYLGGAVSNSVTYVMVINAPKELYSKINITAGQDLESRTKDAKAQLRLGLEYLRTDPAKGLEFLTKAADQGNADAQFWAGLGYYGAYGSTVDKNKAFKYFLAAAEQGNENAQLYVGLCYWNGDGTAVDFDEAAMWIRKSADKNLALAQYDLGILYSKGLGLPQSDEEAVKWYLKAANNENPEPRAYYLIGLAYEYGQGVAANHLEAQKWYRKAADAGFPEAKEKLDK